MHTFTFFESCYDRDADPHTMEWPEWVSALASGAESSNKTSTPCIVLADLEPGRARTSANVLAVTGLALDIERKATDLSIGDYLARWELVRKHVLPNFLHCVYTTWSHTQEDPRYRVLLPLAEPITPDEYRSAIKWLSGLCGHLADPKAQVVSQPSFVPIPSRPGFEFFSGGTETLSVKTGYAAQGIRIRQALGESRGTASKVQDLREACQAVLGGKPFAKEGGRDDMAVRMAMKIASFSRTIDDESAVESVFGWSISQMGYGAPTSASILEKISRGVEKATQENDPTITRQKITGWPYIVQCAGRYFFKKSDGSFSHPVGKEDAFLATSKFLSSHSEVELYRPSESGAKRMPLDALVLRYGELAREIVLDFTTDESYIDPKTDIFHHAVLQRPKLDPEYDANIDEWITLLGGPRVDALKNWLSLYGDLSRCLAALVLVGAPGTGKNLFAHGSGRLFSSHAPSSQRDLTGAFQSGLLKNPLVFCDEEITDSPFDRSFLAAIRADISALSRRVNIKYSTEVDLVGATRYIIASNHLPFRAENAASKDDADAIAERFCWIDAKPEAATFLKSIPEREKSRWATEGIAQYALWLQKYHPANRESYRFGVAGDPALADNILLTSTWNHWVAEWLVNGLSNKFQSVFTDTPSKNSPLIHGVFIKDHKVYIRLSCIQHFWKKYLPENHKSFADTRPLSQALKAITERIVKPQDIGLPGIDNRYRYHEIRSSALHAYVTMSNRDEIEWVRESLSDQTQRARVSAA